MTAKDNRLRAARSLAGICLAFFWFCLSPTPARGQNEEDIQAFVTAMDPNNVADMFGSRISRRYVALQVTVENASNKLGFLIHDISLDLEKVFPPDGVLVTTLADTASPVSQCKEQTKIRTKGVPLYAGMEAGRRGNQRQDDGSPPTLKSREAVKREQGYKYRMSSLEHSLVRGVAEKGQGQDKRNLIFRLLRGAGTVAAGFMGVTPLGKSYAPAVAMFNGPALTAYSDTFPDYTINQLNRLNDSAYRANTLVPRQQSKVMVVFISQSLFLTKEQRGVFKDNPVMLACPENGGVDFRRAEAVVQGSFIQEVNNQPPSLTTGDFLSESVAHFQDANPALKGKLIGKYLANADIKFAASPEPPNGFGVALDGTPTDSEMKFTIKGNRPVRPGEQFHLEVWNGKGIQVYTVAARYSAARPAIAKLEPAEAKQPQSDTTLAVTVTGTGFMDDMQAEHLIFDPAGGVQATSLTYVSPTELKATLKIDKGAPVGVRGVKVKTPAGGFSLGSKSFEVKAP